MPWGKGSPRTSTAAHRRWARTVLSRDQHQCQQCGYQGTPGAHDVEADHINNVASGGDELDPGNGQCLCIPCHRTKSAREGGAAAAQAHRARTHVPKEPHPGLTR